MTTRIVTGTGKDEAELARSLWRRRKKNGATLSITFGEPVAFPVTCRPTPPPAN